MFNFLGNKPQAGPATRTVFFGSLPPPGTKPFAVSSAPRYALICRHPTELSMKTNRRCDRATRYGRPVSHGGRSCPRYALDGHLTNHPCHPVAWGCAEVGNCTRSQGLFEQFRRVANAYFLIIAILSLTPVR